MVVRLEELMTVMDFSSDSMTASRTGKAYSAADAFFGGDKVWQSFSDWMAKVPSVNYGMYTGEADAAMAAQLPALRRHARAWAGRLAVNGDLAANLVKFVAGKVK